MKWADEDYSLVALPLCLMAVLLVPSLTAPGMFFDGVTYASISRNLAEGRGTAWFPFYTESLHPRFTESPPVAFWLQSVLFRFSDSVLVERSYSLVTGLLSTGAVMWLARWRQTDRHPRVWVAGSLFASMPLVIWCFRNNMLENTMVLFVLASTGSLLQAFDQRAVLPRALWTLCAAGLMLLGFLSKGPVALVVLAVPMAAWATGQFSGSVRSLVVIEVLLVAFLAALSAILFLDPQARAALASLWENQLKPGFLGEREVAGSRLYILSRLVREIAVPGALLCVVGLLGRWMHVTAPVRPAPRFYFWLIIALGASLPIMLSAKQHRWFLLPSLPFFALALAEIAPRKIAGIAESVNWVRFRVIAQTVALSGVAGTAFVGIDREPRLDAFFRDVVPHQAEFEPYGRTFICPPELRSDWPLNAKAMRFLRTSLQADEVTEVSLAELGSDCWPRPGCLPMDERAADRFVVLRCDLSELASP